jgi:tRNA U54 and U55 pseudouridine synthase Pus10
METCVEGAAPAGVAAESFSAALREAQRYSDEKYGSNCYVCAEVFDRPAEYMLHITSPIEDMLINTWAAITVRKADGAVTERGIWHSCHARIKRTSHLAPNKSFERTRER